MCNSGQRQERVCRAQRPAAKIDHIATSAGGRDCTPGVESAEMPANCGLFVRDRETSVRIGLRGGPGRIRTSNQAVMRWDSRRASCSVVTSRSATACRESHSILRSAPKPLNQQ
jgi:hypothetical protein